MRKSTLLFYYTVYTLLLFLFTEHLLVSLLVAIIPAYVTFTIFQSSRDNQTAEIRSKLNLFVADLEELEEQVSKLPDSNQKYAIYHQFSNTWRSLAYAVELINKRIKE